MKVILAALLLSFLTCGFANGECTELPAQDNLGTTDKDITVGWDAIEDVAKGYELRIGIIQPKRDGTYDLKYLGVGRSETLTCMLRFPKVGLYIVEVLEYTPPSKDLKAECREVFHWSRGSLIGN